NTDNAIDELVYELYNITKEERKIIEEHLKEPAKKSKEKEELQDTIYEMLVDWIKALFSENEKVLSSEELYLKLLEKHSNIKPFVELLKKKVDDTPKDVIARALKKDKEIVKYDTKLYGLKNWSDEVKLRVYTELWQNNPKKADKYEKIIRDLGLPDDVKKEVIDLMKVTIG
ncbi:MAG: hypothetical protein ACE5J9_10315, partial [Methanosarcinales archaeon]